jgi:hypothetical protein
VVSELHAAESENTRTTRAAKAWTKRGMVEGRILHE